MISDLFGPETFFGHRLGGDFFLPWRGIFEDRTRFYRVASSSFHFIGTNTCNFIVIERGLFFLEFLKNSSYLIFTAASQVENLPSPNSIIRNRNRK